MRTRRPLMRFAWCLFVLGSGIVLTPAGARAQGVIVPGECRRCPPIALPRPVPLPRALPIKSVKVDAKIAGQVATTHVEQVFRNDTDATLEGTYFFPIPETASVSEFAIWEGDRRLVGEVRSREEARRIYDEIVRRQRDPGLLEYAGKNLFQASIFPIPPRSDKKLELTYTQVLKAETATVSYRYPLGTGQNLAPVGTVSGRVEIEGREPLRNIYSPSHQIEVARGNSAGERRARVSFESTGGREPQDFQIFYTLSKDDFGLTLLTHREPGKGGYFLLMLSPKDELAEAEYAAKDAVFVLDTSGSMADAGKMEKARAALLFGVRTLRPGDRFNVISFAGEEHLMANGLIAADEAGRARGVKFVESLRPVGGTNINAALVAALKQFDGSDRPRLLVFMTDGLPTVGETNIERIIGNARGARVAGTRLFTFGVGYDVNTALLDKLAAENGGAADYVEPKEDIEVKVSSFFTKVNYPVLTELQLDTGPVETDLTYPRQMPDLFRGSQVAMIGRYSNERDLRNVNFTLRGRNRSEARSFAYPNLRFPLTESDNDFLPRLWATRRVGWLMEQVRSNGENKELRDEIVDLGTRYGIVTPYTSYLALDSQETRFVTPGAPTADNSASLQTLPPMNRSVTGRRAVVQRERARDGGAATATAPAAATETVTVTSGADAVKESKSARMKQESLRADGEDAIRIAGRKVKNKTFYQRDKVLVDAEFDGEARLPETTLTFGSEEYFALLRREPELAEYFALNEEVVVVYKGRVYRVKAAAG